LFLDGSSIYNILKFNSEFILLSKMASSFCISAFVLV
jgi:hypothetical protein